MDELNSYVDRLFQKYGKSKYIAELKAEILSNLEAKKTDLIASGVDEITAIQQAKESITNVDDLIDGNVKVNLGSYQLERVQTILFCSIIAWIISIPGMLFRQLHTINILLFAVVLIIGIMYLVLSLRKPVEIQSYINIDRLRHQTKMVWIIWAVFIGMSFLVITGILFASNIWFARPIIITGPYQFANLLSYYMGPLFSLVIPIIFTRINQLWIKHEV
jgi:hypothetical protein